MSNTVTHTVVISAGLAMSVSTAFGQITLINSQYTYVESKARGSGGRITGPRIQPAIGLPFVSVVDAASSSSITQGFITNYAAGATIEISLTQKRSATNSDNGMAIGRIDFHIDAPSTYELSGNYPNATIGHAWVDALLAQWVPWQYRYTGSGNLFVPGTLEVGNLATQSGSITGTLPAGDYTFGFGGGQETHTTGLQATTSAGTITLIIGELPCYADCDPSTGAGMLDIFDFLCFQDSFVNSEPYACDCDTTTGPGVCDIFDFLCFQDAFVAGCP